jgi:hypothetical protein
VVKFLHSKSSAKNKIAIEVERFEQVTGLATAASIWVPVSPRDIHGTATGTLCLLLLSKVVEKVYVARILMRNLWMEKGNGRGELSKGTGLD